MIKKNNVVKNIILVIAVVALMGLIVYLVGRSYGFFRYEKQGETTNVITIKGIRVDIIEDDDALNLLNTEPLYDSDGMQLKAFTFSITNTSKRPLEYTMKVVNDTDKQNACLINEGTANEAACPVLTTDNIRYSYKLNNGSWNEAANLGANNDVITTYTINGNETLTYSIKMWIKSDATNDIMNHYFFGQLLIQGTQAAQEMYRPYDVATILSNFNQEDLKEVVACSNDNKYQDCEIYNTIEEAIAAKDKPVIILTNNVDRTTPIQIQNNKDITLDLNDKTMTSSNNGIIIYIRDGALTINGNGLIYDSNETSNNNGPIKMYGSNNAKLVINGNKCNTTNVENYSTGTLIASKASYAISNFGVKDNNTDMANIIINGGCFYSGGGQGIQASGNTNLTINDAYVDTYLYSVISISANSNVDIKGGTYISQNSNTIRNESTGTINITQTDKPIYIASYSTDWKPVINNNGTTGMINITASQANACTANASNTTSGLCVYGDGDGTTNQTGNAALATGSNCSGDVNIDGGTYYGGFVSIINPGYQGGTINIKNAKLISKATGLIVNRTGSVNICSSIIESNGFDFRVNNNTATLNYNDVTFSNGTKVYDSNNSYDAGNRIIPSDTCPIAE